LRNFLRQRHVVAGMRGLQAEQDQRLERRTRIDRKPRAHRGAGGVIDLLDQARGQLDELPFFIRAVRVGLDIEVGQDAQQRRADVNAFAARQRHEPVKTGKQWSYGHLGLRDLGNPSPPA